MRNFIFTICMLFLLTSCAIERTFTDDTPTLEPNVKSKSEYAKAIKRFDKALISLLNPINRNTAEEAMIYQGNISERRKKILIPFAHKLMYEAGYNDVYNRQNRLDDDEIIELALNIYLKNNK